jgi:hypothetical protein
MASLDFLAPGAVAYPTPGAQTSGGGACAGTPVAASSGSSWIDRLFGPQYVDYPVPVAYQMMAALVQQQQQQQVPTAPASAPLQPVPSPGALPAASPPSATPAPSSTPASSGTPAALPATSAPITFVIAPYVPNESSIWMPSSGAAAPSSAPANAAPAPSGAPAPAGSAPSNGTPVPSTGTPAPSSGSPSSAPAMPTASPILAPSAPASSPSIVPVAAQSKILRAFVFNPEFRPRVRTGQEEFLEDELGEDIDDLAEELGEARMRSHDASPVAFVVPDGCDSLDILFGPIEINPSCGCDEDLEEIVTVGEAKLSANVDGIDGPLTPGDQVMITVPWRAASWVELPTGRLRLPLLVNFYKSTDE